MKTNQTQIEKTAKAQLLHALNQAKTQINSAFTAITNRYHVEDWDGVTVEGIVEKLDVVIDMLTDHEAIAAEKKANEDAAIAAAEAKKDAAANSESERRKLQEEANKIQAERRAAAAEDAVKRRAEAKSAVASKFNRNLSPAKR